MAFFDWNHDGKKDFVDTAIEMMILDDIEEESKKNNYNPSKPIKKKNSEINEEGFNAIWILIKIMWLIAMFLAMIINIIGIFTGYVYIPGLIISTILFIVLLKSFNKKNDF